MPEMLHIPREFWTLTDSNGPYLHYVTEASDLPVPPPRKNDVTSCMECNSPTRPWEVRYNRDNELTCWATTCTVCQAAFTIYND